MADSAPSTFDDPQPVLSKELDTLLPVAESKSDAGAVAKKAKKKATGPAKPKVVRPYPSFPEMINDAIATLKERKGSSQYAISKFIENKHKNLPGNFKKMLLSQLKKLVAAEKILKVKGSFKAASSKLKNPKPAAGTSLRKKIIAVRKPKIAAKKVSSKTGPKSIVAKAKAKVTAKPIAKGKVVVKPKPSTKPKVSRSKTKVAKSSVAVSKPKAPVAGLKRKANAVKSISKKAVPPAKVAKVSSKATPAKKAIPIKKVAVKKATPSKAAVAKSKIVKSSGGSRKGPARKGKN